MEAAMDTAPVEAAPKVRGISPAWPHKYRLPGLPFGNIMDRKAPDMELQKQAFQIVIGFMMEGLDNCFGAAMVDILAITATSRDERRRPLLCGIAIKYERVVADKFAEYDRVKVELAEEEKRIDRLYDEEVLRFGGEDAYDRFEERWDDIQRERNAKEWLLCNRIGQWYILRYTPRLLGVEYFLPSSEQFRDLVLVPTFKKWSRLLY